MGDGRMGTDQTLTTSPASVTRRRGLSPVYLGEWLEESSNLLSPVFLNFRKKYLVFGAEGQFFILKCWIWKPQAVIDSPNIMVSCR